MWVSTVKAKRRNKHHSGTKHHGVASERLVVVLVVVVAWYALMLRWGRGTFTTVLLRVQDDRHWDVASVAHLDKGQGSRRGGESRRVLVYVWAGRGEAGRGVGKVRNRGPYSGTPCSLTTTFSKATEMISRVLKSVPPGSSFPAGTMSSTLPRTRSVSAASTSSSGSKQDRIRPVSVCDTSWSRMTGQELRQQHLVRTPSQANNLCTTVPQNLVVQNLGGRHTPTRSSLRHSRMIVLSKNGKAMLRISALSTDFRRCSFKVSSSPGMVVVVVVLLFSGSADAGRTRCCVFMAAQVMSIYGVSLL
ncbi:hypothetical protein E2C01_031304 [Portunus trituberculatus]|uniref:Uncharacterized protein n=1 Tax=Portunus trituberculatus TaxID=210409 RepID=A0A5B7ET34_PORTR|nr:hypothetical protein [Portunus trituberculatus]